MLDDLTAKEVRLLLSYDQETGEFRRLVRTSMRIRVGDVAGCGNGRGYILIRLKNKLYRAHRLAWLYVYGQWPNIELDHIDGNRSNNAIANLREASHAENMQNLAMKRTNKSGAVGVRRARGRWKAEISINGKNKCIGTFDTIEEARSAYLSKKECVHPFNPVPREA